MRDASISVVVQAEAVPLHSLAAPQMTAASGTPSAPRTALAPCHVHCEVDMRRDIALRVSVWHVVAIFRPGLFPKLAACDLDSQVQNRLF